ncbi:MAG: adenylyltransferase/cytidyltransferase family protein [Oribacterium sp.]|nr:adenylyltransferase/cytidyltransferase family protein [Oribacterium sp.]MBP3805377.1 adenylyltransferase/cytidyltransferase family protein [Oribacterium sp.]MCR5008639.1 adenylyltransferase/cytidyltransferase family protein [Oribacterium sp.]
MIITYEDLSRIRKENPDKKIVMLKGTFDLFHMGHLNMIRRAKALGDILVVLVKCDEAIKLKGPDRPIEDEQQRASIVDAIRYVDYTLIADRKIDAGIPDVPEEDRMQYLRYYQLVSDLRPDVLIKPSKKLPDILMKLYNEIGTEIHEVEETKGVSTTLLIKKIRESRN